MAAALAQLGGCGGTRPRRAETDRSVTDQRRVNSDRSGFASAGKQSVPATISGLFTGGPARGGPRAIARGALGVFCAFLAIDLYWVARSLPHPLQGDEWRYIYYADNLLHGYFSPRDRVFLWNGPGYPLLLAAFVKLGWADGARYANALWHAAALAYAWLILSPRMRPRWALGGVAMLGLYMPAYEHLPMAQTEVFCFFLTTAWIEHSLRAPQSALHRVIASALLALLCLTKVVFGVVLMVFLSLLLVFWLCRREDRIERAYLQQAALALALCLPYLAYTYDLTGRPLYWSSAGPQSFYWLSSPYADESGDWYHHGWVYRNPTLRAHHKAIMDETGGLARDPSLSFEEQLFNMSTPEAADVFLREGVRNVREHPRKFFENWCANMLRMFLDVPTSVRDTRFWNSYSRAHLPLLAWTAFVALCVWRRRRWLPRPWWPLGLFLVLSLSVYSFSAATARFLISLVPLWWLGTCCWLGAAELGLGASTPRDRQNARQAPEHGHGAEHE